MAAVVTANPYPVDDPTKVVVTFLGVAGRRPRRPGARPGRVRPEALTVHGTRGLPAPADGQARSKLVEALGQAKAGTASATDPQLAHGRDAARAESSPPSEPIGPLRSSTHSVDTIWRAVGGR